MKESKPAALSKPQLASELLASKSPEHPSAAQLNSEAYPAKSPNNTIKSTQLNQP